MATSQTDRPDPAGDRDPSHLATTRLDQSRWNQIPAVATDPGSAAGPGRRGRVWADRANAAEGAVLHRHVRRMWAVPWTRLGCVEWPPGVPETMFLSWRPWWQAHLIQCAVDAAVREPASRRRRTVARLVRTVRARELPTRLGAPRHRPDVRDTVCTTLAGEHAARHCGPRMVRGADRMATELRARIDPEVGAIPRRRGGDVFDAYTNCAAATLLARLGHVDTAVGLAHWIDSEQRDERTGLIGESSGAGTATDYGAHTQGIALGMETELAAHARAGRHRERACRSVIAVSAGMCVEGVIVGARGGDSGLYAGILVRALAAAAAMIPGTATPVRAARDEASRLVLASARAAWDNRIEIDGRPLFGPDWSVPAEVPAAMFTPEDPAARIPEQDLSVQLSGWMLMEAAARVEAQG